LGGLQRQAALTFWGTVAAQAAALEDRCDLFAKNLVRRRAILAEGIHDPQQSGHRGHHERINGIPAHFRTPSEKARTVAEL